MFLCSLADSPDGITDFGRSRVCQAIADGKISRADEQSIDTIDGGDLINCVDGFRLFDLCQNDGFSFALRKCFRHFAGCVTGPAG